MKIASGITVKALRNGTVRLRVHQGGQERVLHLSRRQQTELVQFLSDLLRRKDATDAAPR